MKPKSKIDSKLVNLETEARPIHLGFETEARHFKSRTRDCLESKQQSRGLHHRKIHKTHFFLFGKQNYTIVLHYMPCGTGYVQYNTAYYFKIG